MKYPKLIVEKYDKVWKFNADKFCGYVCCDRLRKVMPIANHAVPSDKGSWLCDCGRSTGDDVWYHSVVYKEKDVNYDISKT